jgi:hypothetical protein
MGRRIEKRRTFETKTVLAVRSELVLSPGKTAIKVDPAAGDGAKGHPGRFSGVVK